MTATTKTSIVVKTSFIGFHRWVDAPEDVTYLRNFHRHVFHVKVIKEVTHDNRQIEFITFKNALDGFLDDIYRDQCFEDSCEQIAKHILEKFDADTVGVYEDNENGAIVQSLGFPQLQETVEVDPEEIQKEFKKFEEGVQNYYRIYGQKLSLPACQVRRKCFIGTEAEGPHRGTYPVLFVPGCVTPEELEKVWNGWSHNNFKDTIKRIYLGAGNLPYPLVSTIRKARGFLPDDWIDIEVDRIERIESSFLPLSGFTVISHRHEDNTKANFVKDVTGDVVSWLVSGTLDAKYRTRLDDPLYAQDKELDY